MFNSLILSFYNPTTSDITSITTFHFRFSTEIALKKTRKKETIVSFFRLPIPYRFTQTRKSFENRKSNAKLGKYRGAKKGPRTFGQYEANITAVSAGDSNHSNQGWREEEVEGWLLSRTNASRWIVCRRLFSLSLPLSASLSFCKTASFYFDARPPRGIRLTRWMMVDLPSWRIHDGISRRVRG